MARFHTTNRANAIDFIQNLRDRGYNFDPARTQSLALVANTYRTYSDERGYVVVYWTPKADRITKPTYARYRRRSKKNFIAGPDWVCPCGSTKHRCRGLCKKCHDRWYYWHNAERRRKCIARAKMNAQSKLAA